ncbi:MAG: carboxypeptidase regulatory-like domain-containing protein [Candidatus Syntrophosphaera sp.]|nr:carboxypeptidase regulatory-like domain-containing protein [Candidatus Syntrophosphaera sp.]
MRYLKALLIVLALLGATLAFAAIDEYYSFNATMGTYSPITGTNAGISGDDMLSAAIPLGFSFPYGDATISQIKISSNGWIDLGGNQTSSNLSNQLASTTIRPVIAPLWDDTSLSSGDAQYLLSGTAPNRVFMVQYTNLKWNYSATNQFNLQARIYENGKIDIIYGPATGTPSNASASIGINMAPGGAGWYYSVTPGTPPTASSTAENSSVSSFPAQGEIYEFNPVVAVPNDLAGVSIVGNITPTAGSPNNYEVTIRNRGSEAQSAYQVKLFRGAAIEVGSVNGTAIQPGQLQSFTIPWTPDAAGPEILYGKVVLPGDENPANDQTPSLNVNVQPAGVWNFVVGDGNQNARMPLDFYWRNSLYETLYYPAEMGNFMGQILGIQLWNNFSTNLPAKPTKVWIGTTTQPDLSAGWIPSTQLTLVFDGTIDYPSGSNLINIPFNQPYMYLNGENLVLMFNRPMDSTYFSSSDQFLCQTVGSNRARNVYSDSTLYDPANPPAGGTPTGQFPKTGFVVIPGGVGHINGTVTGAGGVPLEGVLVQFATGGYATATNASGQYAIQNILPDDYTVSFSTYGYETSTFNITIDEDETEVLDVAMAPMATVNVSGTVIASDTQAGINGASIHLAGYADYSATTIATGAFTIPAVYANNSYEYVILAPGYVAANGTINVGAGAYDMGTITLSEVAYAPHTVLAEADVSGNSVNLSWQAPDPNATEITESFEDENFPPANWSQIITNTGAPNTQGVFPTWCRVGAASDSGQPINPTDGLHQAGLRWDYGHQDEWLITPSFNSPPAGYLHFDTFVYLGSVNQDHYYVKISTDNGNTWIPIWDATEQTGGLNAYASPITVNLEAYSGQQVKLAFNAVDGPSNDGLWHMWFIDNIYIGNAMTGEVLRFAGSDLETRSHGSGGFGGRPVPTTHHSRAREEGWSRTEPSLPLPGGSRRRDGSESGRLLTGYRVWRLSAGQETNESAWSLLTPQDITANSLTDPGWQTLPNGTYRWAVKAVYTNNVVSVASFSNPLDKFQETGMIAGVVRRTNNAPIAGATVSVPGYSATTNSVGAYTLVLPIGAWDVTCAAAGFVDQTVEGVVVNVNQTTTQNFVMSVVSNPDEVVPVTATALLGNHPNPFNPETQISYSLKESAPVRLWIYNSKGQLIRCLVNADQPAGWYKVLWDGRDDSGQEVSSGLYLYRLSAGSYQSTRRMVLLK